MTAPENKKPLLLIGGPTGVGKTGLSIQVARLLGGEIVSADSMQVYKGLDVGTAKITKQEMGGVPHHLIDILEPSEEFSVARFQQLAREAVDQIHQRGRLPIVVGGTGFYIQALLYDVHFTQQKEDPDLRRRLEDMCRTQGETALHDLLSQKDPKAAKQIHPHNRKRVIRALEYYILTGEPISVHNAREKKRQSVYRSLYYVLTAPRSSLYAQIDRRVDQMMANGLCEEARRLYDSTTNRSCTAMQGIGYRELFSFFDGEISLEESIRLIKRNTRHFAKRQLTWFNKEKDIRFLERNGGDEADMKQMAASVADEARRYLAIDGTGEW